jgi:hypothetical protein
MMKAGVLRAEDLLEPANLSPQAVFERQRQAFRRQGYLEFLAVDFSARRCWRFRPSRDWVRRNPAGAPVSIGYVIGEDIKPAQLAAFIRQGKAREVSFAEECLTPHPW